MSFKYVRFRDINDTYTLSFLLSFSIFHITYSVIVFLRTLIEIQQDLNILMNRIPLLHHYILLTSANTLVNVLISGCVARKSAGMESMSTKFSMVSHNPMNSYSASLLLLFIRLMKHCGYLPRCPETLNNLLRNST